MLNLIGSTKKTGSKKSQAKKTDTSICSKAGTKLKTKKSSEAGSILAFCKHHGASANNLSFYGNPSAVKKALGIKGVKRKRK